MYALRIWWEIGSEVDQSGKYRSRDEAIEAAQWYVANGAVGVAVYKV